MFLGKTPASVYAVASKLENRCRARKAANAGTNGDNRRARYGQLEQQGNAHSVSGEK